MQTRLTNETQEPQEQTEMKNPLQKLLDMTTFSLYTFS